MFIKPLLLLAAIFMTGCQTLFPTKPGKELQHFADRAPKEGAVVPDVELVKLDGRRIKLKDYIGERPVVLQLGSHSCPVYRYRHYDMNPLQQEFASRAHFLTIYTIEAHPEGSKSPYRDEEWLTVVNRATRVRVPQPMSLEERLHQASMSVSRLGTKNQVLADEMSNAAWQTFGAAPTAAFVIDKAGRIVLRQVWVEPKGIRQALELLLATE